MIHYPITKTDHLRKGSHFFQLMIKWVPYVPLKLGVFITSLSYLISASAPSAFALSFDDVISKGEIAIAVYRDFPPFSYRDQGKLVGIDVDIAAEIAKQLGVRLELIEQTADENVDDDLRNAVWKGHYLGGRIADVMLHIPYDRQLALRNDLVVLFGPYMTEKIVLARDPKVLAKGSSLAVFRFDKIAVELDSLSDFYLTSAFGGTIRPNVHHYRSNREAGAALQAGTVAGMMGPRAEVEASLTPKQTDYDIGQVPTPGLFKSDWLVGAAVKNTYRQLGYAIEDIIATLVRDGTIKNIFNRYGITYSEPPMELLQGAGQ